MEHRPTFPTLQPRSHIASLKCSVCIHLNAQTKCFLLILYPCLLRLPHTLPAGVLHRHPFPFHVATFALALQCTDMHGSIPSIKHHGLLGLCADPRCKLSNQVVERLHATLHYISLCLVHNILLKLTAYTYFSVIRTRIFCGSI